MAEKPASRIRYDDIVNAVHSDPAKAEATVILSGYVGRSSEKGNIRIYPDASLGQWYEVAESDVLHTTPIEASPLGGSNVWVKAAAKITPSIPIPPPVEGDAKKGDAAAPQAAAAPADTGVFNPMAGPHPTIWTQFCPTGVGCIATIPCLPPSIGCPPGGGGTIHPTIWTQLCPTGVGCIATAACLPPGDGMRPNTYFPCTRTCPLEPVGNTRACVTDRLVGPTGTQGCTQPGHCVGQTGWHTCACPIGQTGWHTCGCPIGPTGTQGCTQPPHCLGPTAYPGCGPLADAQSTAATLCTRVAPCVGQTGWHTCGCPPEAAPQAVAFGTAATICTQALGCPNTSTCPPTNQVHICPDTRTGICQVESAACPPPPPMTVMTQCFHCVPVWTRQPGCEAVLDPGAQINPTAATRCFICPPLTIDTIVNPTLSTRCFICPPLTIHPTINPTAATRCFICPPIEAAAMVGPTGTQGCTQPGHCVGQTGWHTCGCPIGPTGTQGCTQALGCPSTSTCPPAALGAADAVGPTGTQGCTFMPPCIGDTGWHTCACQIGQTGWHTCGCPIGPTGTQGCTQPGHCVGQTGWHTCACPVITLVTYSGCPPHQSTAATLCTRYHCPTDPVITLVTYSGCPGPSAVDACPTRLCMTIAGPCLPYTMGGCS